MNKLLVHSNNTSFNRTELFSISEQFVFDVDFDKDIDFYIDDNLTNGDLKQKLEKIDLIFIKVSLSQNYLEYLGLRLAYHIRLTKSLGVKSNIPIVFIAEESFQFLGLTYSEPSILFTGGIYLIKETLEDYHMVINWFNNEIIKPLVDFDSFINTINIDPPSNYQLPHSIANEWALTRYFSMLKKDDTNEGYNTLEKKILELDYLKTLHFKYVEAKASRQRFNPKKHAYTPSIRGVDSIRIGIIDDEINKGWLAFYQYVFNKSQAKSIAFNDFKKDESRNELIKAIQSWLSESFQSSKPIDIFIVDLRLHDDDFIEQDFDKLSGIQIIKFIKSKNPGVQIVVSTASNKVWNFQKCLEYGVKYFSIKESPETYSSRDNTRTSLIHFSKQITSAVERSFLAILNRDIQNIKSGNIFINHSEKNESAFRSLTFGEKGLLDQILSLLILDSNSEAIINQCLLLSFQVLENYCNLSTVGVFDFKNSSGKVCLLENNKLIDIFTRSSDNRQTLTRLRLIRGKHEMQDNQASETIISFEIEDEFKLYSSYTGPDTSSLVQIISALHFRHHLPKHDIEKIIKLRYYRSNVAAHFTGKVKTEFEKITAKEIIYFINIFMKIFT